jgi:hypothetical protein
MRRNIFIILPVLLCISLFTTPVLAGTPTPTPTPDPSIQFSKTNLTNDLPKGYAFESMVTAADFVPVKGKITLYFTEDWAFPSNLAIDPDHPRMLSYYLNALSQDIYPFTPFQVEWTVTNAQGRTATSGKHTIAGYDPRYQWQVLKSKKRDLTIYCHDRDSSFKNLIFDTAERSAGFMEEDFDLQLTGPITIVIYTASDEVVDYYTYFDDKTGGVAVSELGFTVQVIEDYSGVEEWINDVIPHEISHLYFDQAIDGQAAPTWLNEGLAQVNEFRLGADYLSNINKQLQDNQPLPDIKRLESNFNSGQWSGIDYEMAYSITSYIIDTYGKESIHAILTKYADGTGREKAFRDVLGVDFATLYNNWYKTSILEEANPVDKSKIPTQNGDPLSTPQAGIDSDMNSEMRTGVLAGVIGLCLCAFVLIVGGIILLVVHNRKKVKTSGGSQDSGTNGIEPHDV